MQSCHGFSPKFFSYLLCVSAVTAGLMLAAGPATAKPPAQHVKGTPPSSKGSYKFIWHSTPDPTQTQDTSNEKPLHLGRMTVQGDIVKQLQQIKVALKRPLSSNPADADKIVCRVRNAPGSHYQRMLDCATNRLLQKRRYAAQADWQTTLELANAHGTEPGAASRALKHAFNEMKGYKLVGIRVSREALHVIHAIPYPKPDEGK